MKKRILITASILLFSLSSHSQYTKEKLSNLITGKSEKAWSVAGINIERSEKKMTFNINNSVNVVSDKGSNEEKWSLKSSDNIRWFIYIGDKQYELIVSYDKKGNEYLKFTHQSKGSDNYQMKLTPIK